MNPKLSLSRIKICMVLILYSKFDRQAMQNSEDLLVQLEKRIGY